MKLLAQSMEGVNEWKDSVMQSATETWVAFAGTDVKPTALLAVFLLGVVGKIGFDIYMTWRRGKRAAAKV